MTLFDKSRYFNSKLLIKHGKLNETGEDDDRYFEFVNGKFSLLQHGILVR